MDSRITSNVGVLGGKPCIAGTRLSIEFILELVASGGSAADIVKAFPQLTPADVEAALRYAARFLKNEVVVTAEVPL
jgi:uncharacterized protein (DUF433 family)